MLVSSEAENRNKRISVKKKTGIERLSGFHAVPPNAPYTFAGSLTVKLTAAVINCSVGGNLTNMQRG